MIQTIVIAMMAALAVHLLINFLIKRGKPMTEEKQTAHLEDYSVTPLGGEDIVLSGYVQGHPKLQDGMFIHTSKVVHLDEEEEMLAETLNTLYTLGSKYTPEEIVEDEPYKEREE